MSLELDLRPRLSGHISCGKLQGMPGKRRVAVMDEDTKREGPSRNPGRQTSTPSGGNPHGGELNTLATFPLIF